MLIAPIRIDNLARLSIARHLHWTRAGRTGTVHLVVPAKEVKNSQDIEFELPAETARLLEVYLTTYRPRLADGSNEWLFPGRNDSPKQPVTLSTQIAKHARRETGLEVNAHLFRHIGAKLYLHGENGGAIIPH